MVNANISAVDHFFLTSCHPYRKVSSELMGWLVASRPEEIDCTPTDGMRLRSRDSSSFLESDSTLETLHGLSEWSITVWLEPSQLSESDNNVLQPIITFGLSEKSETSSTNEGCETYFFQLAQFGSSLVASFRDSDGLCRIIVLKNDPLPQETTVPATVTFSNSTSSVYFYNETIVSDIPYTTLISDWGATRESSIQLFRHPLQETPSGVFQGSILQVSIYGSALPSEQVAQVVEEGVTHAKVAALDLTPEHPRDVVVAEDSHNSTLLWIGSANASSRLLPLGLQLLSFPNSGEMYLEEQMLLPSDDDGTLVLPLDVNSTGIWLEYRQSNEYFNVPSLDANGKRIQNLPTESFEFRVVPLSGEFLDAVGSRPTKQVIQVQHVNHPSSWKITEQARVTMENGLPVFDLGTPQLIDDDIDRVRVDAWAERGHLTLHPRNAGMADFASCSERVFSAWQCVGNGVKDRRMTFLAVPGEVEAILSNLLYEGFEPGAPDQVVLEVFDGLGGDCLDTSEHTVQPRNWTSIHRGCFHSQASIQIPAVKVTDPSESGEDGILGIPNTDFSNFGMADLVFWAILVAFLVCCCTCLRQCCPSCLARGAGVVPEDWDSEEEDDGELPV